MITAKIISMTTAKTPTTAPAAGPAMFGDESPGPGGFVSREIAGKRIYRRIFAG